MSRAGVDDLAAAAVATAAADDDEPAPEPVASHITGLVRLGPKRFPAPELKTLCQSFAPAWLRTLDSNRRHQVFMWGLEQQHGQNFLILDGVTEIPRHPTSVTMDFRDLNGRELWLTGLLTPGMHQRGVVQIRRGPLRRPHRATRLRPRGHAAAAAFGIEDPAMPRLCLPVIDLNARALRLSSTQPLEPGMKLSSMVIAVDQVNVRWCTGIVTDVTEVVEATGRHVYHCGVRLRSAPPNLQWPVDDAAADVTDPQRVRELLWAMCDFKQPVVLTRGKDMVRGNLEPATGDRKELPRMTCKVVTEASALEGTLGIECTVFGSSFQFVARASALGNTHLALLPAPLLRERHRRSSARTTLPDDTDAFVTFRHPVDGSEQTVQSMEVGVSGLSFIHPDAEARFWPGLPLESASVHVAGTALQLQGARVRRVYNDHVGVHFSPLGEADGDALRATLLDIGSSPIQLHDGRDFDQVIELHRSTNLLEPEMDRWLQDNMSDVRDNWQRAHRRPDGLMRTVTVPWQGKVGASLTSVRAYERTWCLQHSSVLSATVPVGAGILHSSLMALASAREDGEYIAGFVDAAARSLHGMIKGFMQRSLAEHRGTHEFMLYAANTEAVAEGRAPGIRRLNRPRDERLVENVSRRVLDPVCASALSLNEGEIALPATRSAYRRLGLARGRQAWGAFSGGRCSAVLLQEFASPGLSLSGLLSAAILLPLQAEKSEDLTVQARLCRWARHLSLPGLSRVRFLLLPSNADSEPVLSSGFAPVGRCSLFAFHRLSLEEYNRYVANRYGLLRGRLKARAGTTPG